MAGPIGIYKGLLAGCGRGRWGGGRVKAQLESELHLLEVLAEATDQLGDVGRATLRAARTTKGDQLAVQAT